jgi:hypothetical protein
MYDVRCTMLTARKVLNFADGFIPTKLERKGIFSRINFLRTLWLNGESHSVFKYPPQYKRPIFTY